MTPALCCQYEFGHAAQPGGCRHGHRLQAPVGGRRQANPGGLRAVPGREESARTELGTSRRRARDHRRGRHHPRPPRPHRLPAAAGAGGIQRPDLLHRRDRRRRRDHPARQRRHPGTRRRLPQQAARHQASPRPAAVRRRGRPAGHRPVHHPAVRPGVRPARRWPRGHLPPGRAHPRGGHRGSALARPPGRVHRGSRPLRRPDHARPGAGARRGLPGDGVHLRRPPARPRRPRRSARRDHQSDGASRRDGAHPGVRGGPGPDVALLHVAAALRREDAGGSGLPRLADGHQRQRSAALPPQRPPVGAGGLRGHVRDGHLHPRRRAVQEDLREQGPEGRHLRQRDGHRRPDPAPPRGVRAGSAQRDRADRVSGPGHPRAVHRRR